MTMREKIEKELFQSKRWLTDLQTKAQQTVDDIIRHAADDIYSITAGLSTSHGSIKLAALGTEIRDQNDKISLLEWFLEDDSTDD